MILTVTANTTFDQTLFVPYLALNRTIRASRTVQSMGGKPTDASWILGRLGIPSLALGFAAGDYGKKIRSMLHSRGVVTDFIEVGGESRLNTVIVVEDGSGQITITTNTLEIAPEHLIELRRRYEMALDRASVVVLGGTLPQGTQPAMYTELIGIARQRNIPVIFDADEPNLSAGLQSRPTYIKPNQHELEALTGHPIPDVQAAYAAGRQLLETYGTCPIITMGVEGGLVVLPDRAYFIPSIRVEVASASGAGDAILAGLAASIDRQQPVEEGLRLGFATATAVVLMPGTADCRPEDVERFLPQIKLIPYP